MDKAVIYGALEFVGFHVCNRLLEKGYCVKGIHFHTNANDYLDEKRLEVGRNANFEEVSIQDSRTLIDACDRQAVIIFSLYDLFVTNNESILTNKTVSKVIFQLLNERKERQDKIVYLLPIQLLANSGSPEGTAELEDFIIQAKQINEQGQFFYLPTIFGPWQPSAFLFQRTISNAIQGDKAEFHSREWGLDAIFIKDALEPLINTIETKKGGEFLLESGISDSWNQCADILKIEQKYREDSGNQRIAADEQITRLTLTKVTPYQESLQLQKKHLSQILRLNG